MKAIIVADAINVFPDYSVPFDVYTDASDFQLGAAIIQRGRPIAYYSKKLTPAQQNYTTTKKELFCIVMTLKEYRKMLAAACIRCWTDHKNLTLKPSPSNKFWDGGYSLISLIAPSTISKERRMSLQTVSRDFL